MVDPNVEMMMILGRLGNVVPFGKNEWNNHPYLDKVDEYFEGEEAEDVKQKLDDARNDLSELAAASDIVAEGEDCEE